MFAVMTLKTEIAVEVLGVTQTVKMSFADGMLGAIPVFDTKENALAWGEGLQVIEMALGKTDGV
jgi:hypothetical protein